MKDILLLFSVKNKTTNVLFLNFVKSKNISNYFDTLKAFKN